MLPNFSLHLKVDAIVSIPGFLQQLSLIKTFNNKPQKNKNKHTTANVRKENMFLMCSHQCVTDVTCSSSGFLFFNSVIIVYIYIYLLSGFSLLLNALVRGTGDVVNSFKIRKMRSRRKVVVSYDVTR